MNSKRNSKSIQPSFQNQQILPWNSIRMQKYKGNDKSFPQSSIFSLSNRASLQKSLKFQKSLPKSDKFYQKPKTAPQKIVSNARLMNKQFVKFDNISKQQIIGQAFEQNLQNMQIYSYFKPSVQQKKQLIFLKPHMKTMNKYHKNRKYQNPNEFMEKVKTEIYRNIRQSEDTQIAQQSSPLTSKSRQPQKKQTSCYIEYFTQYEGQLGNNDTVQIKSSRKMGGQSFKYSQNISNPNKKRRNQSISVLRDKLKNHYKGSRYTHNMGKLKNNPGFPITIIH